MGAFAIGIVPEHNKSGYVIHSLEKEVLKYTVFHQYEGGAIAFDKKDQKKGPFLGLREED